MKCKYITIEREYGSGGTKIARLLSEKTGIPCYGQEILEEVSKKHDISVDKIQHYEETATNSFLYSVYMMTQVMSGNSDMLTTEGHVYIAEQEVIKNLAGNSPAIFLGHCASEVLKEHDGVINVFIRSTNENEKTARIIDEYGVDKSQVETIRRKFDKKRANYYHANTGKKWDDLRNYDVVLDTGKLGTKRCVEMLKEIVGD